MQFQDTKPFARAEDDDDASRDVGLLAAIERHRVSDPGRMRRVLASLQRIEAPVVIGLPAKGLFFQATLWSVDDCGDHLVFHAPREPKVAAIVTDPDRLWGAAYDGNSKVQFDVRGRTLTHQGDTWVVGSHMPSALYVLPRRTDVRARHVEGQEPQVRFDHPLDPGRTLSLRIHDISRGGLAVLLDPADGRLAVGMQIQAARVHLDAGEVFEADFQVQNVQMHDGDDALLRFGCAWTRLNPGAEALVKAWTQRAQRRKQLLSLSLDL